MTITRSDVIAGLCKLKTGDPKKLHQKVSKPQSDVVRQGKRLPNPLDKDFPREELVSRPSWSVLVEVPCPACKRGKFPLRLEKEDFDHKSEKNFGKEFYRRFSEVPHRVELKYDRKLVDKLEDFFAKEAEHDPGHAASLPQQSDYRLALGEAIDDFEEVVEKLRKQGLDAKLIVPESCPRCGGGFDEEGFLLEINYPDRQDSVQMKIAEYSTRHIEIMVQFLQGKDRFITVPTGYIDALSTCGAYREVALKEWTEDLNTLFGISRE